jgi:hypothetical protein
MVENMCASFRKATPKAFADGVEGVGLHPKGV